MKEKLIAIVKSLMATFVSILGLGLIAYIIVPLIEFSGFTTLLTIVVGTYLWYRFYFRK